MSFVLDGTRYFTLLDDAMISMRYARHVALGEGPVWNIGEPPVEGFSNPATTGIMAAVHLLGLSESIVSLPLQILGFVALGVALAMGTYVVAMRVAASERRFATITYFLLAGTYVPSLSWGLQGSETALVAACLGVSLVVAIRSVDRDAFTRIPHVTAGLISFVRVDAIVPALAIGLWLAVRQRRYRLRHCLVAGFAVGAVLALQTAVRIALFGELLPNTYYLKMTGYPVGWRVARGALVYWDFVRDVWPALVLGAFVLVEMRLAPVALMFVASTAYSIYCGGDAWEWWGGANRYLAPTFHFWLIATSLAVSALARPAAVGGRFVALCVAVLVGIHMNAFAGGRGLKVLALAERPLHAEDNRRTTALGIAIRRCTPQNMVIAVDWAGVVPYFSERVTIDLLAKADRVVAKAPMQVDLSRPLVDRFWPGHLKWDFRRSIADRRPTVVVIVAGDYPDKLMPYTTEHYTRVGTLFGVVLVEREAIAIGSCIDSDVRRSLVELAERAR